MKAALLRVFAIIQAWIDKDPIRLYTAITLPLLSLLTFTNYRNTRAITHKTSLAVSVL
jgi:hypothetical protein